MTIETKLFPPKGSTSTLPDEITITLSKHTLGNIVIIATQYRLACAAMKLAGGKGIGDYEEDLSNSCNDLIKIAGDVVGKLTK